MKDGKSGPYLTLRGPAGLIVPCRDRAGRIVALKVRHDDAGEGRSRYYYVSSAGHGGPGPGAPVHCPARTPEAAELVRLTEGELKSDICQSLTGLPTISVPGVSSWRPAMAVLQALGCKTVRLAFDADDWDNVTVARAVRLRLRLAAAGLAVELERWAVADGKGLDDLLAAGKTPDVLTGDNASSAIRDALDAATAGEDPTPPDELARLQDVLDEGGPEALFRDKALLQALADLAAADPAGFAAVRASIRERVSLRDLDRALRPRRQTAVGEGETSAYFEQNGYTYRNVQTKEGPVSVALCNFTARIVEDVEHDDGAEKTRSLALQGTLADGSALPRADVLAADFAAHGMDRHRLGDTGGGLRWHGHEGPPADRATTAVRQRAAATRSTSTPAGERSAKPGSTCTPPVASGLTVCPLTFPCHCPNHWPASVYPPLPKAPSWPPRSGPAWGCCVSAPTGRRSHCWPPSTAPSWGTPTFPSIWQGRLGRTRAKPRPWPSNTSAPAWMPGTCPPAGHPRATRVEGLAFVAKDALLVVDDFCPSGSTNDVQRYHKEADRLFRGQGNRAGRQRMRADASLRPAKPPRGWCCPRARIRRAASPSRPAAGAGHLTRRLRPGAAGPKPDIDDLSTGRYRRPLRRSTGRLPPLTGPDHGQYPRSAPDRAGRSAQHGPRRRTTRPNARNRGGPGPWAALFP